MFGCLVLLDGMVGVKGGGKGVRGVGGGLFLSFLSS